MVGRPNWKRSVLLAVGCWILATPAGQAMELSLDDAVSMAFENHYDIKIAEKEQERAANALESAKAQDDPTVTASTSLSGSDVNHNGFSRGNSNSVRFSMPLYTGGKTKLGIEKAEDSLTASEWSLLRTYQDTELDVVTAYYDVLETEKTVEVDRETVRNYEEHLTNVRHLYAAGSTPKVDLLRSEVELVNAQQALLKAENAYEVAVSKLKNSIRLQTEEPLTLVDDVKEERFDWDLMACLAYAKTHRLDLKSYEIEVEKAKKDVAIAKTDKRPSVSLSVGTGWDKELLPDADNHSLSASVSASWNLFDGNITASKVKDAEIAVQKAELALLKQIDAVDLEVREAYLNTVEAQKRFHTTQVAVAQAEEDYFIANEKYKAGEGIMLDIIDAQLALSTARMNFIQSQYDFASYYAKLRNAMGIEKGETI